MTNEEKAKEIAQTISIWRYACVEIGALEMAEWKDAQFKKYLEKKKADIMQNPYSGHCLFDMRLIDEIINELFEEIEQDNSDRED